MAEPGEGRAANLRPHGGVHQPALGARLSGDRQSIQGGLCHIWLPASGLARGQAAAGAFHTQITSDLHLPS